MRLKSFNIYSYRSCTRTKIPLQRDLTALIGINSSGKSNILNAILLLRKMCHARYAQTREEASFNSCRVNAEIQCGKKTIYMRGKINFVTDERNTDDVQSTHLSWNLKNFTNKSEWISVPLERIAPHDFERGFFAHTLPFMHEEQFRLRRISRAKWDRVSAEYKFIQGKVLPLISEVAKFFNSISYYSASQFSDPSRCPISLELEEDRPLRRMRATAGHEKFMLDLYRSSKKNDLQYKRYLSTVNKSGIGLIENIEFKDIEMPSSSCEVSSGGKIKKIEMNRWMVVPIFYVDGRPLSPNQLSEGTFKTLALLFYVLTVESKLLLIEEPEVCIHHGLLNSILSLIKSQSKQKQIIISTHSDFVLDQLKPENLILVKRQSGKGTTASPLTQTLSKNDFKALRSYLEESGNLGEYWKEGGFENE